MADTFTLNRGTQIGVETTLGTAVAAGKSLNLMNATLTEQLNTQVFTGIGRRYAKYQTSNQDWTDLAWTGALSYEELQYPISSLLGAATITTPAGGTNSKKWVWTPALTGPITPKSFTIQQGDAVRAQQVAGVISTGLQFKFQRTGAAALSGAAIGWNETDGASLTGSPTLLPGRPIVGKQVNVYYDTTSGGIGVTQLTRVFEVEFGYTDAFGVFWPLNRSLASWAAYGDMLPKPTVKIKLMADSNGMALLADARAGTMKYLRIDCTGDIIEAAVHNQFTIDCAVVAMTPSAGADEQTTWAKEFEFQVVEDTAWGSGTSSILTLVNMQTAL